MTFSTSLTLHPNNGLGCLRMILLRVLLRPGAIRNVIGDSLSFCTTILGGFGLDIKLVVFLGCVFVVWDRVIGLVESTRYGGVYVGERRSTSD